MYISKCLYLIGYGVSYINHEDQALMADLVTKRLNLGNPLDNKHDMDFEVDMIRFPSAKSRGWGSFKLKDVDKYRTRTRDWKIPIPVVEDLQSLFFMNMGNFR